MWRWGVRTHAEKWNNGRSHLPTSPPSSPYPSPWERGYQWHKVKSTPLSEASRGKEGANNTYRNLVINCELWPTTASLLLSQLSRWKGYLWVGHNRWVSVIPTRVWSFWLRAPRGAANTPPKASLGHFWQISKAPRKRTGRMLSSFQRIDAACVLPGWASSRGCRWIIQETWCHICGLLCTIPNMVSPHFQRLDVPGSSHTFPTWGFLFPKHPTDWLPARGSGLGRGTSAERSMWVRELKFPG